MPKLVSHRVYLPLTPQQLGLFEWEGISATVVDEEFLAAGGFSPLSQLRGEEQEVAEDAAVYQAAARSAWLQKDNPQPRLVVAVAEYNGEITARADGLPGEYTLSRPVTLSEVVSFHVSEPLPNDLDLGSRILAAQPDSDNPHPEAEAEVDLPAQAVADTQIPDLLWFDVSELKLVKDFLGISG